MSCKKLSLSILLTVTFCLVASIFAVAYSYRGFSFAETVEEQNYNRYYYDRIPLRARKFYDAIASMEASGTLKSGRGEYDLIQGGVISSAEAASYAQGGNLDVLTAFGTARDAFALDNPQVFYVDFSHLSVSVGTKNGEYVATLGTGRSDNFYLRGSDDRIAFSSVDGVNAAITAFQNKINELTSGDSESSAAEKVTAANLALINNTEYSFESTADGNGTVYTENEAFVHTAYGAAVVGKSVCEGYAKAFKVMMDALNVPCVLVQGEGYVDDEKESGEAHMWNYVMLDGKWYAVDVTWNDTTKKPASYLLLGSQSMLKDHSTDGVVSSAGYEFRYPALHAYDYAQEGNFEYRLESSVYGENLLDITIGYKGQDAATLKSEGKYLAISYGTVNDEAISWSAWSDLNNENYKGQNDGTITVIKGMSTQFEYARFALIDEAPSGQYAGVGAYPIDLDESHILDITPILQNGTYGNYISAPYVQSVTPSNTSVRKYEETLDVVATYNEDLKRQDGQTLSAECRNSDGSVIAGAEIKNLVWEESNPRVVSFTLTPGKGFSDYDCRVFINGLVSKKTDLNPDPVTYTFRRTPLVCNKVFGDGRLYMQVYGSPEIIANDDLSLKGWQIEKDGVTQYAAANQLSQLMLVASKPNETESAQMERLAEEALGSEVLKSATYQIELRLCGCVTKVPNGSYMQVGFGFPEGYGPEDAGVTFKVYHYKNDGNGNIIGVEEIPCVVTEYGIVATVNSFSPFAVVAVDKNKVSDSAKNIYAYAVGEGNVSANGEYNGAISVLKENESVTYTFAPKNGYSVEYVLLNGEKRDIANNALTLGYADIDENNTLEVGYVADSVKTREAGEGITHIAVPLKALDPMGSLGVELSANRTKCKKGGVVILVASHSVENALVSGSVKYEWYRDDILIEGENGDTLSVYDFDATKAGEYTVKAVYEYGWRVKSAEQSVKLSLSGANVGLIVGITVGAVVLVGVIVFVIVFCKKPKKAKK